jgi:hypothetical protein
VHALAWHPSAPGRAYEAGGGGAAWSTDGGRTWEPADEGHEHRYAWALAVDPEENVSAASGPRQAHGGGPADAAIYRWEGAGPWRSVAGPLDAMPYALATLAGGVILAGLADGTLMRSDDRGESWDELHARADRSRPRGDRAVDRGLQEPGRAIDLRSSGVPALGDFRRSSGSTWLRPAVRISRDGRPEPACEQAFRRIERRGRDSNPRWTNQAHNGFRDRRTFMPLRGHLARGRRVASPDVRSRTGHLRHLTCCVPAPELNVSPCRRHPRANAAPKA